ncbi:ArdC family protein [Sphingomonas sp. OTU376]|uniref:ArdC family protein n=1 Tax=Sphingomonas sp. OTU376 TaxID=3043863 RepID=UPI00313E608E
MAGSDGSAQAAHATLYQQITGRIIADLEAGRVPWVQPWSGAGATIGMPYNGFSDRRYSGINILTLWNATVRHGFTSHAFLTFRQAVALGGSVRRGEQGIGILYTRRFAPGAERSRTGEEGRSRGAIPFLKWFTVFAVDQCEGLPPSLVVPAPPVPAGLIRPQAEALIAATGADFRIGGPSAYYSPSGDFVAVPRPDDFHDPVNWHRTAFHELSHWAGHRSRLDRDQTGAFGSVAYGKEELIAEMGAAFVCAALGIVPTVRHADYIGSWLEILRADNRAILRVASAASRAADYLLAFRPEIGRAANDDDGDDGPHGGAAAVIVPASLGRIEA